MGGLNWGRLAFWLVCLFWQPAWAEGLSAESATRPPSGEDPAELAFYYPNRVVTFSVEATGLGDSEEKELCKRVSALAKQTGTNLDLGKVIAFKGRPLCYQHLEQQGMPWPEVAKNLGVGPLHVAVKYNNRKMVKWLIQQNPDLLNRQDKEGRRPLLYSQDDAMVKFLLEHGATPPEEWDK